MFSLSSRHHLGVNIESTEQVVDVIRRMTVRRAMMVDGISALIKASEIKYSLRHRHTTKSAKMFSDSDDCAWNKELNNFACFDILKSGLHFPKYRLHSLVSYGKLACMPPLKDLRLYLSIGSSKRKLSYNNQLIAIQPEGQSKVDRFAHYVSQRGGSSLIKKILIANNGMAATKFILSIRQWAHMELGDEKAIKFVAMASPEDLKANAEFIRFADSFVEVTGLESHLGQSEK